VKTTTHARVVVTIEMPIDDTWGPDCPQSQVFKQAKESAENRLRQLVTQSHGTTEPEDRARGVAEWTHKWRILDSKVLAVTQEG
jgi:hypothetical protein